MKKTLIALLIAAMILCGSALANEGVSLTNPWTKTNPESIERMLGTPVKLPEEASDVVWMGIADVKLAEIQFTLDRMEYTLRIQPTEAFEDISGLYYDWENINQDFTIGGCPGWEARIYDEDLETTIDLCLWYDAGKKLMYALSTSGPDHLNGFDITAVAQQIYPPA